MNHETFFDQVYRKQDTTSEEPNGWIQWKGTEVCIDLHCTCGYLGHVDADFFYFYECPSCKTKYAVSPNVRLVPLTKEQVDYVYASSVFTSCDLEED